MGFWDNIGLAVADDNDDKVDRNIDKNHDSIMREEFEASIRNLPKDKMLESNGFCVVCGTFAVGLGNDLCATCWDYVVDFSSPNIKLWPDATQYAEIHQKRSLLNLN